MANYKETGKKIVDGVETGYKKIEEKFTDTFLKEDASLKTGEMGQKAVWILS